jgi:hypothetical protein
MPTYSEIQKFVQRHHGFVPKTGWIAHVKALRGVSTRRAANRPAGVGASHPARPRSGRPSSKRSDISV